MPSVVTPYVTSAPVATRPRPSLSAQGSRVVIIAATAWVVLVSGVAYMVHEGMPIRNDAAPPASAIDTLVTAVSVAEPQLAVRFANPFDPAEVFEFPSDTSEADAREAVASFLLDRARARLGYGESPQDIPSAGPAVAESVIAGQAVATPGVATGR